MQGQEFEGALETESAAPGGEAEAEVGGKEAFEGAEAGAELAGQFAQGGGGGSLAEEVGEALGFGVFGLGDFEGLAGGGGKLVVENSGQAAVGGQAREENADLGAVFHKSGQEGRKGEHGAVTGQTTNGAATQKQGAEASWSQERDRGFLAIGNPEGLVGGHDPGVLLAWLVGNGDGEYALAGVYDAVPTGRGIGQSLRGMVIEGEAAEQSAVVSHFRHRLTDYRNSDKRGEGPRM